MPYSHSTLHRWYWRSFCHFLHFHCMSKFPNISSFYQSVSGWVAKAPDINANMGPKNIKSQPSLWGEGCQRYRYTYATPMLSWAAIWCGFKPSAIILWMSAPSLIVWLTCTCWECLPLPQGFGGRCKMKGVSRLQWKAAWSADRRFSRKNAARCTNVSFDGLHRSNEKSWWRSAMGRE